MATHMGKKLALSVGALSCFAVLSTNRPALAAIDYGDFSGTSVEYLQVTEDSPTPALLPLFGAPSIAGDSLVFSPPDFSAASINGAPEDTTTGELSTTVVGLDDMGVSSLQIKDIGDYTLEGLGTSATNVTLSAPVVLNILSINGAALGTPIAIDGSMTFSPSSAFSLPADSGSGVIWNGVFNADLAGAIAGAGLSGTATSVSLDMSDTLTASSEVGTIAVIEKKTHDVISIATTIQAVPEPTSIGLLAITGGALLKRRRRN